MEFRHFLIFLPPNPLEDLTSTLSAFSLVTGVTVGNAKRKRLCLRVIPPGSRAEREGKRKACKKKR